MSGEKLNLIFILVNYKNEKQTLHFLTQELFRQNDTDFQILIVDNSNSLPELKSLQNVKCKILAPGKNTGYFGAADYALKDYLKNNQAPDAVILSNTDISFDNAEFISSLKKKIVNNEFSVMGPDITSTFLGQKQNPYMRKRISKTKLKIIYWLSGNFIIYNLFLLAYFFKTKVSALVKNKMSKINLPCKVYGVHGSFMVFHKNYFHHGGSFEYPSFLFGEEIFAAELCRLNNLDVMFDPSLQIVHQEHSTTGIFKSKEVVRYIHQSYSYLLNRFF